MRAGGDRLKPCVVGCACAGGIGFYFNCLQAVQVWLRGGLSMRLEWLSNWEIIHTELAILIAVVWLGLHRIESLIKRGLQSAGLVKLPEGKSKCPACGDITWIPS